MNISTYVTWGIGKTMHKRLLHLASSQCQGGRHIITGTQYRFKATASVLRHEEQSTALKNALPFSQIPGTRGVPLLGTIWDVLPPFASKGQWLLGANA